MQNQFTERYKTLNLLQLVDVIVNPQNYNEMAVAAAHEEIERRNISQEELDQARNTIYFRDEKSSKQEEKIKKISGELSDIVDLRREKSPDSVLKIVCGGIALLTFFKIYTGYGIVIYTFKNGNFNNPFAYIWLFTVSLTIAIMVLLWNKVKTGYYLFYGWTILNLALTMINLYYIWSVFDLFDTLWPPNVSVINAAVFGFFFWMANSKKFRQAFHKIPKEEEIEKMIKEIKTD